MKLVMEGKFHVKALNREELYKRDYRKKGKASEVIKKIIALSEAIYAVCDFSPTIYVYRGSDGFTATHNDAAYH